MLWCSTQELWCQRHCCLSSQLLSVQCHETTSQGPHVFEGVFDSVCSEHQAFVVRCWSWQLLHQGLCCNRALKMRVLGIAMLSFSVSCQKYQGLDLYLETQQLGGTTTAVRTIPQVISLAESLGIITLNTWPLTARLLAARPLAARQASSTVSWPALPLPLPLGKPCVHWQQGLGLWARVQIILLHDVGIFHSEYVSLSVELLTWQHLGCSVQVCRVLYACAIIANLSLTFIYLTTHTHTQHTLVS